MNDSQSHHRYAADIAFQSCLDALALANEKFSECHDAYLDEIQHNKNLSSQNDKFADELYLNKLLNQALTDNICQLQSKVLELDLQLNIQRFVSFSSSLKI